MCFSCIINELEVHGERFAPKYSLSCTKNIPLKRNNIKPISQFYRIKTNGLFIVYISLENNVIGSELKLETC